jgi:AcrR family transcriptional regulator
VPRNSTTSRRRPRASRFAGEDLRQQVLDAARDLFAREGYPSVSMRRIAAEVGCSAMAMYRYFAGKEELLISICEETFERLAARRDLATQGCASPLERLRVAIRTFVKLGIQHPHHYKLAFLTDIPPGPNAVRKAAIVERGLSGFREMVRECAAAKGLEIDVDLTVQVLRVAAQGLVAACVVQPSDIGESDAVAEHLIQMLTQGFE